MSSDDEQDHPLDNPALVRLHAAHHALREARDYCQVYQEHVPDDRHALHQPMLIAIVMTYCRPFTSAKGWGSEAALAPLMTGTIYPEPAPIEMFSEDPVDESVPGARDGWNIFRSFHEMHNKVLEDLRHKNYAHTDGTATAAWLTTENDAIDERILTNETLLGGDIQVIQAMCDYAMTHVEQLIDAGVPPVLTANEETSAPPSLSPEENMQRQLDALCVHRHDLDLCREFCATYVQHDIAAKPLPVRLMCMVGIVATYTRPFAAARRNDYTALASDKYRNKLALDDRELHDEMQRLRNSSVAHAGEDVRQPMTFAEGKAFFDELPSGEFVPRFGTMAARLVEVLDAKIDSLAQRLGYAPGYSTSIQRREVIAYNRMDEWWR